ncbi:DUF421 domain-containing protein|uniref:Uncharacterized membrane protein YcaP, DUF421 family n=1 Tax=Dendrosporobacter quercicolus TaxID=146817 RepID=A0A1G9XI93_9FIRM|nr:DUF421 domain-containing protein [Dendrosporobacter quercicolus]NSL49656.1 DUF421 domain-containing protein [Dendrosporobacter quercicolus DSM 1736]SDM96440.1 Uncharacterized membrane protein YcaP, DUF421 family [Dendrosporobacter quercicolus]
MEIINDLVKILGRIVTILPLMLLVALFMGRRAVGELPVFDFLLILSLGAVVGADIAEPDINHFYTAFAIVAIGLLQRLVSELTIRNHKFKKWTTFAPVVVIKDGRFVVTNLQKIKYSVDNVLELLRIDGVFSIEEVEVAIVEGNGRLSVYKKPAAAPAQAASSLAYPVIIEGQIYTVVLAELNLNEGWLKQQLLDRGIGQISEVFFATVDQSGLLHVSTKDELKRITACSFV